MSDSEEMEKTIEGVEVSRGVEVGEGESCEACEGHGHGEEGDEEYITVGEALNGLIDEVEEIEKKLGLVNQNIGAIVKRQLRLEERLESLEASTVRLAEADVKALDAQIGLLDGLQSTIERGLKG